VYFLAIHADAQEDLEKLWVDSPTAAARIAVMLEEIHGSQDLLDALTVHDFGKSRSEDVHVSKWQEHWRAGRDIWRFKIWDLESMNLKYRIIYAFQPGKQLYTVLGIFERDFNYASDDDRTKRILTAYNNL
jgi:mRNA-degrading endonuclease RelE of RelBE toxin-antitoxin system